MTPQQAAKEDLEFILLKKVNIIQTKLFWRELKHLITVGCNSLDTLTYIGHKYEN